MNGPTVCNLAEVRMTWQSERMASCCSRPQATLDARPSRLLRSLLWLKKMISLTRTVLVFLRSLQHGVDPFDTGEPLLLKSL
jgi:hypothetical protein